MPQEEIKRIAKEVVKEYLAEFIKEERYIFQKHIQLFDGRNIQVGQATGTKIGTETTQKLGLYNTTPTAQQSKISDPTAAGATYLQATAQSSVDAIKAIIDALETLGITAAS